MFLVLNGIGQWALCISGWGASGYGGLAVSDPISGTESMDGSLNSAVMFLKLWIKLFILLEETIILKRRGRTLIMSDVTQDVEMSSFRCQF